MGTPSLGEHHYSLDSKHRMVVPTDHREELIAEKGNHFILATGFDGCIWLLRPSQWQSLLDEVKDASRQSEDKRKSRAFRRSFYSRSVKVTPDEQGRILIPRNLVDHAKLKKDVVVAGAGNKVEIWDRKRWAAYSKEEADPSFEELSAELDL
ncbi:division/cell wall cluster transcriptional repressor MraZ [Elusimicrobiota bacterium]